MSASVAIVGAGLSGLIAGGVLRDAGSSVVLFDKGRRPGGRANTREHGAHRFDHGAQFFTVRDPWTRGLLEGWVESGVVAEWPGKLVRIGGGTVEAARPAERYVGVPGMVRLAERLAQGLDVRAGVRIERILSDGKGWSLVDSEGADRGTFPAVIVAVPAPQAVPLLSHAPRLQAQARAAEMAPCWAGMFVFEQPLALGFDGAFLRDEPLTWLARDSSKPGRPADESWVVHASPEWTRQHWDTHRDEIPGLMLDVLESRFRALPPTVFQRAHRWGYALTTDQSGEESVFDGDAAIGVCGDWCRGGRVEGAILSGRDVAKRVLGKTSSVQPMAR